MTKADYLMRLAWAVSVKATCPDLKVGCIIATDDGHVLSTGFNGVAHGERHCRTKNGRCLENGPNHRVVHAEQNAISHAAKQGIKLEGQIAYITHRPCFKCRELLKQSGIKKLVIPWGNRLKRVQLVFKTRESQRRASANWNRRNLRAFIRIHRAKAARYRAIPEYANDKARWQKYGLRKEEFLKLEKAQGGKCKICGNKSKRTLHVDHCHETGKIRGLLCASCNYMLGFSKDNQRILYSAISYLKKSKYRRY